MAIVKLEGQEVPIPDELAATDEQLRASLAPFYPEMASGEIKRETRADGQVVISVVKRAGTKGLASGDVEALPPAPVRSGLTGPIINLLEVEPEQMNPSMVVIWGLMQVQDSDNVTANIGKFLAADFGKISIEYLKEVWELSDKAEDNIKEVLNSLKQDWDVWKTFLPQAISNYEDLPVGF
jgi:hypothetical protein